MAWHQRRNQALQRDKYRCQFALGHWKCGFDEGLTVHHIKHRGNGGTDALANLVTLCAAHHEMLHPGLKLQVPKRVKRREVRRKKRREVRADLPKRTIPIHDPGCEPGLCAENCPTGRFRLLFTKSA